MKRNRRSLFDRFLRDRRASTTTIFTLSVVPFMMAVGVAIDYSRVNSTGVRLQNAVDSAALASVGLSGDAANAQVANLVAAGMAATGATISNPVVTTNGSTMTVSASATVATTLMSSWAASMTVTRSATVAGGGASIVTMADRSCILTTGENLSISTNVMTFDGSPSVNLTGCSLRSNKSMVCNGGSTGATTFAVGGISGCSNPNPNQPYVPDIYASLANNITRACGGADDGYAWTPTGALPAAAPGRLIYVSQPGYTELHVCGNLFFSGVGSVSGASPSGDTVIVVENGGILFDRDANVSAQQTTFVLAGGRGYPIISWPSGNGNVATFSVSASNTQVNPWKGVAVYEDPSLNYDMTWKPGTNFQLDGLFYFPRASFTVNGNMTVGPTGCSKIVAGEFTLNGTVNLAQSAAACDQLQVVQYQQIRYTPSITQ